MELNPTLYHQAIRDHLQRTQPEMWNWFTSTEAQANYSESVELDLLKTSYRLDAEAHPTIYQVAGAVAQRLGIEQPLTLYQSQVHDNSGMNAMLRFLPNGVHVVFVGPVAEELSEEEFRAMIGHELAHHLLFTLDEGDYLVVDQILNAMAGDPRAEDCHVETCRRYNLYTEIFADRGATLANDDLAPAVSLLVKVGTGMSSVDSDAYLAQAREVLARDTSPSEGFTHPECYIRARALDLWQEDPDAARESIHAMIAGRDRLGALDLLEQHEYTGATRRLIQYLLQPTWFRGDAVLAQARQYFADFAIEDVAPEPELAKTDALKSYFAFVLLDFALVDRDLEDAALARCHAVAEEWGCLEAFTEQANSIGKVTKKQLTKVKRERESILSEAAGE